VYEILAEWKNKEWAINWHDQETSCLVIKVSAQEIMGLTLGSIKT